MKRNPMELQNRMLFVRFVCKKSDWTRPKVTCSFDLFGVRSFEFRRKEARLRELKNQNRSRRLPTIGFCIPRPSSKQRTRVLGLCNAVTAHIAVLARPARKCFTRATHAMLANEKHIPDSEICGGFNLFDAEHPNNPQQESRGQLREEQITLRAKLACKMQATRQSNQCPSTGTPRTLKFARLSCGVQLTTLT